MSSGLVQIGAEVSFMGLSVDEINRNIVKIAEAKRRFQEENCSSCVHFDNKSGDFITKKPWYLSADRGRTEGDCRYHHTNLDGSCRSLQHER